MCTEHTFLLSLLARMLSDNSFPLYGAGYLQIGTPLFELSGPFLAEKN